MAKESMKAREVKRLKLVERYAAKRAALKEAGDQEGLAKLPRNSNPIRLHNRCKLTGRPKGYMRHFAGTDPGREESQLVACGAPCAARPGRRRTKGVPPPDENRTGRFPGSLLTVRFFFLPLPPDFYGSAAEGGHPLPRRPVKQVRSLSPGTQRIQPEGRALCPQSAEGRY